MRFSIHPYPSWIKIISYALHLEKRVPFVGGYRTKKNYVEVHPTYKVGHNSVVVGLTLLSPFITQVFSPIYQILPRWDEPPSGTTNPDTALG